MQLWNAVQSIINLGFTDRIKNFWQIFDWNQDQLRINNGGQ